MPWFRVPFVLGAEELALLLVPNRSTLNNVNIMLTIDIVNTRNTRRRQRGFGDGMCSESLPIQEAALEKTEKGGTDKNFAFNTARLRRTAIAVE